MIKKKWGKRSAEYAIWIPLLIIQVIGLSHPVAAQAVYDLHQSERSDAVTGGRVEVSLCISAASRAAAHCRRGASCAWSPVTGEQAEAD